MRKYLLLSFLVFSSFTLLGLKLESSNFHLTHVHYLYKINNYEKEWDFHEILLNNLIVICTLILGTALLGIPTFVYLSYNAVAIGNLLISTYRLSPAYIVVFILPHGIFEIPAIIIAGAAGFKIPYEIVRYLAGKKEQPLTKEDIKEYFTLALISIILIVIAAFVEAYITPKIAKYYLLK